jgi:hypothetical protein
MVSTTLLLLATALPADAGAARGWVFGGVMCRQAFPAFDRWLSVLGWSADESKVAFIEKATDSFACGWGRPATLRIFDVASGRQLESLHDGCPAADLFLGRRAEVEALLAKHGVSASWVLVPAAGPPPKVELGSCRRGACVARLRDERGLRAELSLEPPDASVSGARANVVLVAKAGGRDVAFVRARWSEETHGFSAIRLSDPRAAAEDAWRDALPGVHFTSTDPMCGSLTATTSDDGAAKSLAKLEGDLLRRVKRFFGADGLCVVGTSQEGRALVLDVVGQDCVGVECPPGPCKTKLELTIGPDFAVRQERRLRYEGFSCSP